MDLKQIDDRTQLAGTNRLELLTFRLSDTRDPAGTALYGINVFKVRELMVTPRLMPIPEMHPCMAGVANIRGKVVPVIDLDLYMGFERDPDSSPILVVTEFNRSTQGFLVDEVDSIMPLAWSDVQEPPEMIAEAHNNVLTAFSPLEGKTMLLTIDVERVIDDVLGSNIDDASANELAKIHDPRMIFFCDDSAVARAQVTKILDRMGVKHMCAVNGLEAHDMLMEMADKAEAEESKLTDLILAVVTDVEMPKMDGYVLTSKIKADKRFKGVPVMMHSSLSTTENKRLGLRVGADGYIPKLQPREFSKALVDLIAKAQPNIDHEDLPKAA